MNTNEMTPEARAALIDALDTAAEAYANRIDELGTWGLTDADEGEGDALVAKYHHVIEMLRELRNAPHVVALNTLGAPDVEVRIPDDFTTTTARIIVAVEDVQAGDVEITYVDELQDGIATNRLAGFERDEHEAGRVGWLLYADGTRTAVSRGEHVTVLRVIR
jgi:hypothetical protein